jgi:hypothetical protein
VHPVRHRPLELHRPPRIELVAKPGGGLREITRLDPVDAATYRRLVAELAPGVEASLGPGVAANRVVGPGLRFQDPWQAHRRWLRALSAADGGWLLTDVRDCYASIRPAVVAAALDAAGVSGRAVCAFLGQFVALP